MRYKQLAGASSFFAMLSAVIKRTEESINEFHISESSISTEIHIDRPEGLSKEGNLSGVFCTRTIFSLSSCLKCYLNIREINTYSITNLVIVKSGCYTTHIKHFLIRLINYLKLLLKLSTESGLYSESLTLFRDWTAKQDYVLPFTHFLFNKTSPGDETLTRNDESTVLHQHLYVFYKDFIQMT